MNPERSQKVYELLKNFWGVTKRVSLFKKDNIVGEWMPELKEGFYRPTFLEFIQIYNINIA